ncbi:MAG: glycosyltransferase family 4 protein, partial [Planctomycetes bacterium]|nr:glycosyltransferase family 4 protein [Planctomycetota bacterium]
MKILFVSHHFPPTQTAGTETYAYNLARRLKNDHRIWVFFTEKRIAFPQYHLLESETDGIPTRIMINNLCYGDFTETYSNPGAEQAFCKVLDEIRPDLVHVHHLMYLSLKLPAIAKARGIPVVMTLHDFYLICPRNGQLLLPDGTACPGPEAGDCPECLSQYKYRQGRLETKMITAVAGFKKLTGLDLTKPAYAVRDRVLKKDLTKGISGPAPGDASKTLDPLIADRNRIVGELYQAVDLFMSPSRTVGDRLVDCGLPCDKLRLWRYGIDTGPFQELDRPARPVPVFGYLGSLMMHKGVHIFVQAAASLNAGRFKFLIQGSPGMNPRYARQLRGMASKDTIFKPAFPRSGVGRAFEAIDVLVLPSLWLENSPIVIQEAFASGCPVITSDLGGMAELVDDGVNGRLFPPGDVEALAKVMEEVGRDPSLIDRWKKG